MSVSVAAKQIGPYVLLGELGRGGMGVVYRARREDLNREFALKVMLRPDDPKATERFLREARAAAALSGHPGIVAVHDVGEAEDGSLYLAMDRVRGAPLDQMIDEMQLDPKEWARMVGHAAEAIHFAHAHGILHRDIKPGNILADGEMGRARVTDFGLAYRAENVKLTKSGEIVGTPAYMSPEQAAGDPLDERSDVWSLGATLYECLAGRPPFDGATALNVLAAVMTKEPRRIVGAPRDLESIVMKCLEKEPDRRYPSALALAQDIGRFVEGKPVIAKPAGFFDRLRKRVKSNPVAAGALALATVAVTVGGLVVGFQHLQARARQEAVTQAFIEAGDTHRAAYEASEGQEREENYIAAWSAYQGAHRMLKTTPEHSAYMAAETALADMAWGRLQAAEADGIRADAARFHNDLTQYGAERYAEALRGDGILSLNTNPSGATVECLKYVDHEGRLVAEPFMELGQTPLKSVKLPMGSYLLIIKKRGYRDTRYPVLIERLEKDVIEKSIPLYTEEQIGEEFIYVPAGESILGGDSKAFNAAPREKKWVEGFLLAKHEVTFKEYAEFIYSLLRSGIPVEQAQAYCPRAPGYGKWVWSIQGGRIKANAKGLSENTPIFGISWNDMTAYCEWLSEKTGREITVPMSAEWERAARGADGRYFVWGNGFDASWVVGGSLDKTNQIHTIMQGAHDVSVFGVYDLAGSMTELCFDDRYGGGSRSVRGGAWNAAESMIRAAFEGAVSQKKIMTTLGFRVRTQPKK